MADAALSLAQITRCFTGGSERLVVLRGASLNVARGEAVALEAPSGAGKTTLLHIAGLLDRPDTGHVTLMGCNTAQLSEGARTALRRRVTGFVYQFHHLLPDFTARENIVLPQLANNVPARRAEARADELLQATGLAARAAHRPVDLSGGEAQRVALCRALANAPPLLLADEPTGNLDPTTATHTFELLIGLVQQTGMAALIATHNPDLAARLDRRVRLSEGRIVEEQM